MTTPQSRPNTTLARGNLLDQVQVQYGPPDLIGRFLLWGEAEARRRGISLSFESFEELAKVNVRHRDTWLPLIGVFEPSFGMLQPDTAYCILGRNASGEVVSAQAARLYDWPHSSFHDEAESLRLVYESPAVSRRPGEAVSFTTDAGQQLTGRVVFSGAGWYHKDCRNSGLSNVLPRLSRAIAMTMWDPNYVMTIMAEPVFEGGFAKRGGFTNSARMLHWQNSTAGDIDVLLVWMTGQEAYDDLGNALEGFTRTTDERQVGRGRG